MRGTAPSIRSRPPHFSGKISGHSPDAGLQLQSGFGRIRSSTQACAASSQSHLGDLWSGRVGAFPHEAAFRYRSHSSERQQDDHEQTSCGQKLGPPRGADWSDRNGAAWTLPTRAKWGGSGAILLFTTSPVRCCRGHWVEAGGKTGKAARDAQRLATEKLLVEALMFPETDAISTIVSDTVTVLFRRRLVDRVLRLWTEMARGGRFPRRDQIEPSMLGEDWANCLLIAVRSPVRL